MKLTPFAKIILILLVLGGAVGGYRFLQKSKGGATGGTRVAGGNAGGGGFSLPKIPGLGGGSKSGSNSDGDSGSGDTSSGDQNSTDPNSDNELQFITSASKKGWIVEQIDKFNALPTTKTPVVLKSVETREAMHQILDGKAKPALWSPSSVIWADRLAEAYKGKTILDTGDSDSYRVILRTPLVFLTTKQKAGFLRPMLSSAACWSNIRKLSSGQVKVPWGQLKWAHADPLNANSGMLSLALILADYAERTGQSGSIENVANSAGFVGYLKELEKRIIYNAAVEKGSSQLVASFADDPSRYDFIVSYESAALEEVRKNPDLAVIYPTPTANSESAVAVLDGPWLSSQQKAGARAFLKYLSQPEAAKDGLKEHFRPSRGATLDAELTQYAGAGFRQSYSAIELPPYAALNAAAFKWRVEIAKKPADG